MKLTGWGYEEIGWLLEQVRKEGGVIPDRYHPADGDPAAINSARHARLGFGQAISGAFSWHRFHRDLTSDAPWKQRVSSLAALRGQVSRIQRALDADPRLRSKLSDAVGFDNGIGLHEISLGLRRLGDAAQKLEAVVGETAPLPDIGMTAQEMLLDRLAKAYREGLDF